MNPKLIDPYQGKGVGEDEKWKAQVNQRLNFIEGALAIHGTFMQVQKKFFEALPQIHKKVQDVQSNKEGQVENKVEQAGKDTGGVTKLQNK